MLWICLDTTTDFPVSNPTKGKKIGGEGEESVFLDCYFNTQQTIHV